MKRDIREGAKSSFSLPRGSGVLDMISVAANRRMLASAGCVLFIQSREGWLTIKKLKTPFSLTSDVKYVIDK